MNFTSFFGIFKKTCLKYTSHKCFLNFFLNVFATITNTEFSFDILILKPFLLQTFSQITTIGEINSGSRRQK